MTILREKYGLNQYFRDGEIWLESVRPDSTMCLFAFGHTILMVCVRGKDPMYDPLSELGSW